MMKIIINIALVLCLSLMLWVAMAQDSLLKANPCLVQ
jgi:hypothetical protein